MHPSDVSVAYRSDTESRTESLYIPEKAGLSNLTDEQLARGMCPKSGGEVKVCMACKGREGCSFGLEAIRRALMAVDMHRHEVAAQTDSAQAPKNGALTGFTVYPQSTEDRVAHAKKAAAQRRQNADARRAATMPTVLQMIEEDATNADIGRAIGVTAQTVANWLKYEGIVRTLQVGRRPKTVQEEENVIKPIEKNESEREQTKLIQEPQRALAFATVAEPEKKPRVQIITLTVAGECGRYTLEEDGRVGLALDHDVIDLDGGCKRELLEDFAHELLDALEVLHV